ncbi:biotin--[acetyl-CoA-carboxylase] ligase [Natronoflexus pectinivorans]|uniref:BirA family biotin operon repressor/biotin-[acetyl-CoA-carboxylase] ligase n=1 Tax=Natronoflexus pectinivorans TaxID=682526 RepID=A0A4R2GPD2_9BACT|nr:biotin--[acetyl-CoA-carboxylase] ligase [Natronoflexus pectinivorans]TCO10569.1 BirA family biotin operon repressor/biotin-[acetyl-CoA-carboxylase] ligase [Natronoflexus pectinivorans]
MYKTPEVFYYDELVSTSQKIKELDSARNLPEFSAVIAGYQTAGRGQGENRWESEKGKNLTFSLVLKPHGLEVPNHFRITQVVSLAIIDWLNAHIKNASIKWPNDIYAGDLKMVGMLIENSLAGKEVVTSVVGIGLNLNQEKFISGAPNPISLKMITGKEYDVEEVFQECMQHIMSRYLHWLENGDDEILHRQYFQNLYRNNGVFLFRDNTGEFSAQIREIEPDGHLVLETSSGMKRFAFKEVEFLR